MIYILLVIFSITAIALNETRKKFDKLKKQVAILKEDNKNLQAQLRFFTEIKEDSTVLNVDNIALDVTSSDRASAVLDKEQTAAFSLMENSPYNIFISGKAGTGKSFLLKAFAESTKKKILKLSPTGLSALNINGATIHSCFGFHNINTLNIDDISMKTLKLSSEKLIVLREIDSIIIDEISMVRSDTFEKIDKILRVVNRNKSFFGGKQIIVFGDLFQLPPISDKQENKYLNDKFGGIYFFDSYVYKNANFKFIELTKNHRQKKDHKFFELLNKVREGEMSEDDVQTLNKRYNNDTASLQRIVQVFPNRRKVEQINSKALDEIAAPLYSFDAHVILNKHDKQQINIDSLFRISATLELKLGSLVMLVNNDTKKRWVNGSLGIVSMINDEVLKVTIDGYEHEVMREEFSAREAKYVDGKIYYEETLVISQFPIVLAYAITIHKSQGMTYQNIACDVSHCFATGQAYVALSRCSSLDGLHLLKPLRLSDVKVCSEVKDFYLAQENYLHKIPL